ncbi:hypothetical protein E2C01_079003 [Portunus trituberculatus]|uniref:Uncharacterized protein n=1 Tax=Portunus trituberculatus TaxID=210409 RepID=A0A5B7IFU5_PORTR|nr:hypothetical protein [Portunus trituberculatus]
MTEPYRRSLTRDWIRLPPPRAATPAETGDSMPQVGPIMSPASTLLPHPQFRECHSSTFITLRLLLILH